MEHLECLVDRILNIKERALILSLGFLDSYDEELNAMNCRKVGRPFTDRYIEFLSIVRYLFVMPYRQLEGFTRALSRLIPRLPSGDYSGLRKHIFRLDLSSYKDLKCSGERIVIRINPR